MPAHSQKPLYYVNSFTEYKDFCKWAAEGVGLLLCVLLSSRLECVLQGSAINLYIVLQEDNF